MSRASPAPKEGTAAADIGSVLRLLAFVNSVQCTRNYGGLTRIDSEPLDHRI